VRGIYSNVTGYDCTTIHHCDNYGVLIEEGGTMELYASVISDNGLWGVLVKDTHSSFRMLPGYLTEEHNRCFTEQGIFSTTRGGSHIEIEVLPRLRSSINTNGGKAVQVLDSGTAELYFVQAYENSEGLQASGEGSYIQLEGVECWDQHCFLYLSDAASARIEGTKRARAALININLASSVGNGSVTVNGASVGDSVSASEAYQVHHDNTIQDMGMSTKKNSKSFRRGVAAAKGLAYEELILSGAKQETNHLDGQKTAGSQIHFIGPKVQTLHLDGKSSFAAFTESFIQVLSRKQDKDTEVTSIEMRRVEQSSQEQSVYNMAQDFTLVVRFKVEPGRAGTILSKTSLHPFEAFGSTPHRYSKSWYLTAKGSLNFAIGGPTPAQAVQQSGVSQLELQVMHGHRDGLNDGQWHVAAVTYRKRENRWRQYVDLGLDDLLDVVSNASWEGGNHYSDVENWEGGNHCDVEKIMHPATDHSTDKIKIGYTSENFPSPSYLHGKIHDLVYFPLCLEYAQIAKFIPFRQEGDLQPHFWEVAHFWDDPTKKQAYQEFRKNPLVGSGGAFSLGESNLEWLMPGMKEILLDRQKLSVQDLERLKKDEREKVAVGLRAQIEKESLRIKRQRELMEEENGGVHAATWSERESMEADRLRLVEMRAELVALEAPPDDLESGCVLS